MLQSLFVCESVVSYMASVLSLFAAHLFVLVSRKAEILDLCFTIEP